MRRSLAPAVVLGSALVLPFAAAWAQPSGQPGAGHVDIAGEVEQPASYSIEALAARPALEVRSVRENGTEATYAGPLLWPMLAEAHLRNGPGRGAPLQHVLIARGADGYAVALSIGEVNPDFENKPVIIATKQDGAVLAQPRLLVPGDRKPGRAVRDLVAIDVR